MTEWCWLNGTVMPLTEARVSVEDRGFQFADGVYESIRLYNNRPFELPAHIDRLARSCEGIRMSLPLPKETLISEIVKLAQKSGVRDGFVYLQITRGSSGRNHVFPKKIDPTVVFYIRQLPALSDEEHTTPYSLLSMIDERWNKCWIKSLSLLENVLAKNTAVDAGADEAIFIHNGLVTEGSASNIFMVSNGTLVTHPVGPKVLPGITRDVLLRCCRKLGMAVEERGMTLQEAKSAEEIFITSSTRELVWVNRWDNDVVGTDHAGAITKALHAEYRRCVEAAIRA